MSRPIFDPYPDRDVADSLKELCRLSASVEALAMEVRDHGFQQGPSLLSVQATICRLESAAGALRSIDS